MMTKGELMQKADEYLDLLRGYMEASRVGFDSAADDMLTSMDAIENEVGPVAAKVLQRAAVKIMGSTRKGEE